MPKSTNAILISAHDRHASYPVDRAVMIHYLVQDQVVREDSN